MDLPGPDAGQILRLRERPAQGVDELKVVGVQLSGPINIPGNQRAEALPLRRAEELRVPILARWCPVEAGHVGASWSEMASPHGNSRVGCMRGLGGAATSSAFLLRHLRTLLAQGDASLLWQLGDRLPVLGGF